MHYDLDARVTCSRNCKGDAWMWKGSMRWRCEFGDHQFMHGM